MRRMRESSSAPRAEPQPCVTLLIASRVRRSRSINVSAAVRNFDVNPRLDYRTVSAVNGE